MRVVSPASDAALARQLFLDAPVAAVLVDSAGVVRGMNNAFGSLHGLSAQDLIGRSFDDLVVGEDHPSKAALSAVTDGPSTMRLRTLAAPVPVEVFTAGTRLGDGSAGLYIQLIDRRPQCEREQQLEELASRDHIVSGQ